MNREKTHSPLLSYATLREGDDHDLGQTLRLSGATLDENIRYCVRASILMRQGEYLLEPQLGSQVRDFLFRPFTRSVTNDLSNAVKESLHISEPRIEVLVVETSPDREDRSQARVAVQYRIKETQKVEKLEVAIVP